ncbi:MAG: DUF5011 domain-containing protein [Bacilli bacterium]|nr:DUF5011 domain-containing protein [Bacilli bacterium]
MKKLEIKLTRRVKLMLTSFSILSLIVIAATYAWYISLREVYITSFDLKIDTNLNLLLSLDGKNWDNVVFIDEFTYNDPSNVYEGNTNAWSPVGLIPMSTDGTVDINSSRLKIYQKVGINTTAGGYRLLAQRVNNTGANERYGYIAFDLFIKNFSNKNYTQELNFLTEEAIYLGVNSIAKIAEDGGVPGKGIENSVRVAFAQIGRVIGSTNNQDKITSISCNNVNGKPSIISGITGLCENAVIWEPNDLKHVEGALKWYNESCLKRVGSNIDIPSSYGRSCSAIKDGVYYPSYVIHKNITELDNVDIYDGAKFNGYLGSSSYLKEITYFTDTQKNLPGLLRSPIFTLAPNSITKFRVYVYIEGQDIDNYEYAQDGKRISIEFGFTKDRFNEDDVYIPEVIDDIWKPVITIDPPETEITIDKNSLFTPPKATATDKIGEDSETDITEDISSRVKVTNNVNTSVSGEYEVLYEVSDLANNFADPIIVKVIVV